MQTAYNDTALRILEQARDLFMQYGLKSVSMDDISNRLGMSKKTLYQYFADKEELVAAVVLSIIKHNQQTCELSISKSKDAIHEMFLALQDVSELFSSMNPSILFDLSKYYPKAFQIFHRHKNDFIYNVIRKNLERGIQEGLYRNDLQVDIISRLRLETTLIPFNPEFFQAVKANMVAISEEMTYHYLYGIVSIKGYKMTEKYKNKSIKK